MDSQLKQRKDLDEPIRLGPGEFSLVINGGAYGVRAANLALTTPKGKVLATPNGALIRLLLEELGSWPYWHVLNGAIVRPRPLGVYTLFSWQLDRFETATTIDNAHFRRVVLEDPVLHPQA